MIETLLLLSLPLAADPKPEGEELKLLKTFRDEFVLLTPGEGKFPKKFIMGSDSGPAAQRPAHQVTFEYSFSIAKYEVPQDLWQAVMGSNPSRWKGPRNSVEMLSHDEATEFCRKVTQWLAVAKLIEPGQLVRLPSEAEWEYAARAGTDTRYSFGDDVAELDDYGWHTGNAAGNDPPVGAKKPNPWGLYDMHGYLWEWCLDSKHADYRGAPADGSAWVGDDPAGFVIRSGSWKDKTGLLESRARSGSFRSKQGDRNVTVEIAGGVQKDLRDDALGLRCVLTTKPKP